MRLSHLWLASVVLMLPSTVLAQRPKVQISDVRVGFPGGVDDGVPRAHFKGNAWAPIYVEIEAGREGIPENFGQIEIVVEAPDGDDVLTKYTISRPLPGLSPREKHVFVSMTKIAPGVSDVNVSLSYQGQPVGQTFKKQSVMGQDPNWGVYLALGSRVQGLGNLLHTDQGPANVTVRDSLASLGEVGQMPEHWFGYQCIDLAILTSGKRDFVEKLQDPLLTNRREALSEWVSRGGHLIICAGANRDVVTAVPELNLMLPVKLADAEPIKKLALSWGGAVRGEPISEKAITVTKLEAKPERQVRVILQGQGGEDGAKRDLIVQSPFGFGMVTVIAFDPELTPFVDWSEQGPFWKRLLSEARPRGNVVAPPDDGNRPNFPGVTDGQDNELLGQMYGYLENFEEVPVISFGWVALFILLYIIVVGPLDYWFLKKVVKRLELTWVTFPTVVLFVSAVAYFTAYHLKGKDLRIRKVDMVDVDLSANQSQMVGHTWFTLFSPRIQHYTIGIEPVGGTWVPEAKGNGKPADVLVSWLSRPTDTRGMARTRSQSFFRRSYDYADPEANGLKGVPIQVWSTKSFTASWRSPIDREKPLLEAKLRHNDRNILSGDITWLPTEKNIPASLELQDACVIYNNQVFPIRLPAGTPTKLEAIGQKINGEEFSIWMRAGGVRPGQQAPVYNRRGVNYGNNGLTNLEHTFRTALFWAKSDTNNSEHNASLESLDQTQRLGNPNEAILVGRFIPQQGAADQISENHISATRLWLGTLPKSGGTYVPPDGIMRQETYVRFFIPVDKIEK